LVSLAAAIAIFTGNLVAIATTANDEGGFFGNPG
jgi:hypothetical protein